MATLEPAPSGGAFSEFSEVLRLPDGRFLVYNELTAGEIELYSSTGEYVRTISRQGEGPGEFEYVREMIVVPPDSVGIVDIGLGRLSILGPDLSYVRSEGHPYRPREVKRLPDGRLLMSAQMRSTELAGLPLHVVGPGPDVAASFGGAGGAYRAEMSGFNSRPIAVDENGDIWAGFVGRYVIDRFNSRGEEEFRIVRRADWFPDWARPVFPNRDRPPNPQFVRLAAQGGQIWALTNPPAADWKDHIIQGDVITGDRMESFDGVFDSRLEVFDASTGDLMAALQVTDFLFVFADDQHVVSVREGPDFLPRLDVWRIQFHSSNFNR